jgi:hypothetical protein
MAVMPTLTVEVAFASDSLATSPTWTDITSYVRHGSIKIGRTNELDNFSAGHASLALNNRARTFDPLYSGSISPTGLKARRQLRIRATYSGTTYDLFYGFVSGWPLAPTIDGDSICQVQAYDGLAYLASVDLPTDLLSYTIASYSTAPVAWWPLGDSQQVITDQQNAYPFTFNTLEPRTGGAPTAYMAGSSSSFDGTYGALGPAVDASGAWTVSFFFKTNTAASADGLNPILMGASATDPASIGIDSTGRLTWRQSPSNTSNSVFVANNDIWHHGCVKYTGSGAAKIYVDGVYLSSSTEVGSGADSTGWQLIGASNVPNDDDYFNGELAHITIWHVALADADIVALASAGLRGIPGGANTTDDWITTVLDAAGWPASWRSLDTGTVTPGGMAWGQPALNVLQDLALTERGRIFVNRLGSIEFQDAGHDYTDTRATTSQATYSDSLTAGTVQFSSVGEINYSDQFLANKVTVTTAENIGYTSQNTTSQTTYGIRARQIDTLMASGADALTRGVIELDNYATPALRISEWTVAPSKAPTTAYPKVLGARLADRVTFELQPNKVGTRISTDLIVESIQHEFTPDRWVTTFSGSPAVQAWLLEDATYGLLESTTILG